MKSEALRTTITNISSLFVGYKPYTCSIPRFLRHLQLLACFKDKGTPAILTKADSRR